MSYSCQKPNITRQAFYLSRLPYDFIIINVIFLSVAQEQMFPHMVVLESLQLFIHNILPIPMLLEIILQKLLIN